MGSVLSLAGCHCQSSCGECSENTANGGACQPTESQPSLPASKRVQRNEPRRCCGCVDNSASPGVFCLQEERGRCSCEEISAKDPKMVVQASVGSPVPVHGSQSIDEAKCSTSEFGAFGKSAVGAASPLSTSASSSTRGLETPEERRFRRVAARDKAKRTMMAPAIMRSRKKVPLQCRQRQNSEDDDEGSSYCTSSSSSEPEVRAPIEERSDQPYYHEMLNKDYDSALLIACYIGDAEAVETLITKFAALPTCRDEKGYPAGYFAAMSGCVETLKAVIEKDQHSLYGTYFDCTVTLDNMTPLMTFLRHGLTDVIDFFIYEKGCKLRLLGSRFGIDKDALMQPGTIAAGDAGLGAPVRKWMELCPEIGHVSHISKRRPLVLPERVFSVRQNWTPEEVNHWKQQRMRVRHFLRLATSPACEAPAGPPSRATERRNALVPIDTRAASDPGTAVQAMVISTGFNACPSSSPHSPRAVLGSGRTFITNSHAWGSPRANEMDISPSARDMNSPTQFSPSTRDPGSSGSADRASPQARPTRTRTADLKKHPTVWRCGSCGHYHDEVDIMQAESYHCDGCGRENTAVNPRKAKGRKSRMGPMRVSVSEFRPWEEDDGEGEYWENAGTEFTSEEDVQKHLLFFKRSIMWTLGPRRLRELLRIVKVMTLRMNDVIFHEGSAVSALYALKVGRVTLDSKENAGDCEMASIDGTSDDKNHPGVKVLDVRAFMDSRGVHKTTAKVRSSEAVLFVFHLQDVVEYCGDANTAAIMHDSLSVSVVQMVPVLRLAFAGKDLLAVAQQLTFKEYRQDQIICRKGERIGYILIVQRGTLLVEEGSKQSILHVGGDQREHAAGTQWVPFFAIGVRLLLYDLTSTTHVQVRGAMAEVWVLEVRDVDRVMRGKQLLPLLQMSTYVLYLQRLAMFKNLKDSDERLKKMIVNSQTWEYWNGEIIITQGDMGDSLFVLVEGTVAIIVDGNKVATLVADIDNDKVHFFGEIALLEKAPRAATVQVESNVATALRVEKASICDAFGTVEALLDEQGLTKAAVLDMTAGKRPKQKQPDSKDGPLSARKAGSPLSARKTGSPLSARKAGSPLSARKSVANKS